MATAGDGWDRWKVRGSHAFFLRVGGLIRFAHSAGPALKVHGQGVGGWRAENFVGFQIGGLLRAGRCTGMSKNRIFEHLVEFQIGRFQWG